MGSITGKTIMEHITDLLNMLNLNNGFGKILIATIIIFIIAIVLAFLKANAMVILFAIILLYVLFTVIEFIPSWTLIIVGGLGVLFIFIKYSGGGGGDD